MVILLSKLLDILLKKDDKNLTQISKVECCGQTYEITCKTITECEKKVRIIIEEIKKLQNLSEKQEKYRQEVLKKYKKLERNNNFKEIEF